LIELEGRQEPVGHDGKTIADDTFGRGPIFLGFVGKDQTTTHLAHDGEHEAADRWSFRGAGEPHDDVRALAGERTNPVVEDARCIEVGQARIPPASARIATPPGHVLVFAPAAYGDLGPRPVVCGS
jgi:hypothetical protein